ncbi:unnamed protein product [Didymodactylos carnosus]|uniref:Uncharacterized protein n=1 Tax=Didymodactylos carnosus TaxID=1234261 RepID=A0A814HWG9_9BILA|nr:unnamed protein product [Didymodactylos carnosus]CAF1016375.1 unnamed protein product [Didymodactylos carnosus]CAF3565496.1 unnamed protein product [Didymodactylos carnosus]CAF3787925.1 unnamed protein product [Didymodactylos carnosus]
MPNESWQTVGKSKKITTPSKSVTNIPKAEVKNIKLSDSAFSSMRQRETEDGEKDESTVTNIEQSKSTSVVKPSTLKPSKTPTTINLKQALQNIDVSVLENEYSSTNDKTSATSVWVEKVIYAFIEQIKDVTTTDPIFAKEDNDYPMNALKSPVRDFLSKNFKQQSILKAIKICRESLLNTSSDSSAIVGYQVLLQFFIRHITDQSDRILNDVDTVSKMLKKYSSDKIMRLLWCYSQFRYKQPGLALEIWFRLFYPLIENRVYNQFVVDDLAQLTKRNSSYEELLKPDNQFSLKTFLEFMEFIDRPNPAITKQMRCSLGQSCSTIQDLFIKDSKNLSKDGSNYFKILFPLLSDNKQRSAKNQTQIDRMIMACFDDKTVSNTWLSLHKSYPKSTISLLNVIKTNSKQVLSNPKERHSLIQQLRAISSDAVKLNDGKHTPHDEFLNLYKENDTITSRAQGKGKRRFFKLTLFLMACISLYYFWPLITLTLSPYFKDHLHHFQHPVILSMRKQLQTIEIQTKKTLQPYLRKSEEYIRSSVIAAEPYVEMGYNHARKQVDHVWKYLQSLQGPASELAIVLADQIRQISFVIYEHCIKYLSILFDMGSRYTEQSVNISKIYVKQLYVILYDQWEHLDTTDLKMKAERLIKTIKTRFSSSA